MSATLQADWFDTVDFNSELDSLREQMMAIPTTARTGPLWDISKSMSLDSVPGKAKDASSRMVSTVLEAHESAETHGMGRVTLVIVNRVDSALELHEEVVGALNDLEPRPDVELIHSRFRGMEREKWPERFLSRGHCENPATNMILIATQVIEAGVDISATALVTQLAPWPSLVQRFGRAARYGGTANVTVVDTEAPGKDCLPYHETDLAASTGALALLQDVGIAALEAFEDSLKSNNIDLLNRLYRYEYIHLLTRGECDELFDTSPDLTGADIDVSRFIRSGDENDVQVCWFEADWNWKDVDRPPSHLQPARAGLCPVPVHKAKDWVFNANRVTAWKAREKRSHHAWVWDYLEGSWHPAKRDDLYPGRIVLVDATFGGYDVTRGFNGEAPKKNSPSILTDGAFKATEEDLAQDRAELAQDREDLSDSKALKNTSEWKTIATHCREVADRIIDIASPDLSDDLLQILHLAARLHDWGKSHPAFQSSIKNNPRLDTAKAPDWVGPSMLYCMDKSLGDRKGFRHEMASAIAVVELLARRRPQHEALLGPYSKLIELGVLTPMAPGDAGLPCPLADELEELDAARFDLLVWLICAHHGKVRGSWQATPQDQDYKGPVAEASQIEQTEAGDHLECGDSSALSLSDRPEEEQAGPEHRFSDTPDLPIRGICNGDTLPSILLPGSDGESATVPELSLDLSLASLGLSDRYGRSWIERAQGLLKVHGPFALAWLEAVLRAADVRSSKFDTDTDPLFNNAKSES
jgi:CRISPR-associated endonuclease/helicase Cas3